MTQNTLTLRKPDDWHVHLRDGAMLDLVADFTARQFARAIVMPNLTPPVTTVDQARAYRDRINAAVPARARLHAVDDGVSDRHD
jgi:dihydroorotase